MFLFPIVSLRASHTLLAHALWSQNMYPGMGGSFLPLSASPESLPGTWWRYSPTIAGLCVILGATDAALAEKGLLWTSTGVCLYAYLYGFLPSFIADFSFHS